MAMSTEASGFDYGRYEIYHTQKDLSNVDPEQWMNLVDLARDDLHTNYEFSGDEYPLDTSEDNEQMYHSSKNESFWMLWLFWRTLELRG